MKVPDLALPATSGAAVNLAKLKGRTVVYIYPRTGVPGVDLPPGWDDDPRRARLHAAVLRFPRPSRRTESARRRPPVRPVDAGHRLSAGGGGPPASAVRDPLRREAGFDEGAQAADFHGRRHDAVEAHGAGDRRRGHHQGVLSGVSARQERGGCGRLDSRSAHNPEKWEPVFGKDYAPSKKTRTSANTLRNISGVSTPVLVL